MSSRRRLTKAETPRTWLSAGLLLLLACAAACDSETTQAGPRETVATPEAATPFPAALTRVPEGYREVRCPGVTQEGTDLVVRMVVPDRAETMNLEPGRCSFGWGLVGGVSVTLEPTTTLASVKKKDLEPFEDTGGDDDINSIAYTTGNAGFGSAADDDAELLEFRVYNDGLPFWQRTLQSDGVRIGISVGQKDRAALDQLDVVRRSVGVLRGDRAWCPGRERSGRSTVAFVPPKVDGWISRESHWCRIYFDGAPTTLEYGVIDPAPVPLAKQIARLRKDPEVTDLQIAHGSSRLAGHPADRITWTVVRTEETENYEPAGIWHMVSVRTDDVRVEWGQTPDWWRTHEHTFDDLVRSVRTVR